MHDNYNHVASLVKAGKGVSYESFKRLIELDVNVVLIKEAFTALQALIMHLATFILEEKQINVDLFLNVVLEWAQALLASAQTRMPPDRSSWQTWLFGESVRRTIIMCYVLAMSLSSFKYGYCSHWQFLESLPFGKRAGLWMAESPQSWIAVAGAKFGEEVGEQLISFHKFAESLNGSDVDFRGDTFLALLAYGHNGVEQRTHSLPSGN